jgi:hypothetical protein
MKNIAPTRARKAATVIATTEPVDTDGGELLEDDEEDVTGVGLDVEVVPESVVKRPKPEFVGEPVAPSNKLDPGLTPEAVSPPETPVAVGVTVPVPDTGI